MNYTIKWRISSKGTLLVLTDHGFYEFRDLLCKELRFIDAVIIDPSDYWKSVDFQLKLINMVIIHSINSIEDEPVIVFESIYKIVKDLILTQRMRWQDFLLLSYSMGKKSYNCLEFLLEQDMSYIGEMRSAMMTYLNEEKAQMEKIRND